MPPDDADAGVSGDLADETREAHGGWQERRPPGKQGFRRRIRRCEDEGVSGPAGRPTGQVSARRAGRCARTRELR